MKALAVVLASVFLLMSLNGVYAHGEDKPKRGGIMGRGADLSIELVMENGAIALYFEDHGAPIPTKSMKGTLSRVVLTRRGPTVTLVPAGENKMTASGMKPAPGDWLRAQITLPNGDEVSSTFTFR